VLLLLVLSLALAVLGRVAAVGRLPKNPYVGVRTMIAMTNERSWDAANRAAGPWWLAAGILGVAGAAVIALLSPSSSRARLDVGVVVAVMFVLAAVGAVRGDGAARRALGEKSSWTERRPPRERGGRRNEPPGGDGAQPP
jgi:uncharacterized membrane protein